jgi:membrane fusion protein (multidrug efflux system)
MTVVPMRQDIYVVGNFKETEITDMYRGQHATITIDAFPDATLHGTVDSIAPGSGSQFSLLPPENATGNFTKIVQRVPVKILLDPQDPDLDRLRPGLSVEVDIDQRTTPAGPRRTLVAEGPR